MVKTAKKLTSWLFGILLVQIRIVGQGPYSTIHLSGKIEAYFQIKFSRACVNHFLRMRCHMKGKIMDIKAIYCLCKRLPKKPEKLTQNRNLRVQMKICSTTFHCSNSVMLDYDTELSIK